MQMCFVLRHALACAALSLLLVQVLRLILHRWELCCGKKGPKATRDCQVVKQQESKMRQGPSNDGCQTVGRRVSEMRQGKSAVGCSWGRDDSVIDRWAAVAVLLVRVGANVTCRISSSSTTRLKQWRIIALSIEIFVRPVPNNAHTAERLDGCFSKPQAICSARAISSALTFFKE